MNKTLEKKASQYHHGNLKEAMILKGAEILKNDGLHSLSLKKIATSLKVSIGAPYKHFPTKNHFLAHISERGFSILTKLYEEKRQTYQKGDPQTWFNEFALSFFEFGRSYPEYYRIMFTNALPESYKYDFLFETGTKAFKYIIELVESMQSRKIFRMGNPLEQAITIWTAMHGFTSLYIDERMRFLGRMANRSEEALMSTYGSYMNMIYQGLKR